MVTRLTAVFGSPEEAEEALKKVRESVRGVYSTNFVYDRISDRSRSNNGASMYTGLSAAVTTPNYLSAVNGMADPAAGSRRSRKATVFIVCDGSGTDKISSILTNMGGSDIK